MLVDIISVILSFLKKGLAKNMEKNNYKAWLYLAPAILFLGFFMVYPLIDVFIYSFEEGYITSTTSCTTHTSCRQSRTP